MQQLENRVQALTILAGSLAAAIMSHDVFALAQCEAIRVCEKTGIPEEDVEAARVAVRDYRQARLTRNPMAGMF